MGSNYYEVIGIVQSESASESGTMQTPDQQTDAYIPLTIAKEHFGDIFTQTKSGSHIRENVELHQLIVEVSDEDMVELTAAAIERQDADLSCQKTIASASAGIAETGRGHQTDLQYRPWGDCRD